MKGTSGLTVIDQVLITSIFLRLSYWNINNVSFLVESLCKRMLAATQTGPLLLGQYKPSCDADGHFNRIQYHEGYYFCVDDRGIPDFSTKTRSNKPKCPGKAMINFSLVALPFMLLRGHYLHCRCCLLWKRGRILEHTWLTAVLCRHPFTK